MNQLKDENCSSSNSNSSNGWMAELGWRVCPFWIDVMGQFLLFNSLIPVSNGRAVNLGPSLNFVDVHRTIYRAHEFHFQNEISRHMTMTSFSDWTRPGNVEKQPNRNTPGGLVIFFTLSTSFSL